MPTILHSLARHTRILSLRINPTASQSVRLFHSPFVVLNTTSPLTKPSPTSLADFNYYEKQHDHSSEPQISHSGTQTYVVSEPDPADTPYEVPSGAYPTSTPYVNFNPTEPPNTKDVPLSSTSSQSAHPYTARAVPHNESGVGQSAAARNAQAPGEMGGKGGSYGGLDMMSKQGTEKLGDAELADRNPPPNAAGIASNFSKLGMDQAWKHRK